MFQLAAIGLLSISPIIAYFLSLTLVTQFLPQLIALLAILFVVFHRHHLPYIYLITALVSLIVFCTGGLQSPFFFLVYFLLFVLAFQFEPGTSLSFSLVVTLLLSQSINSVISLIPLSSLVLITPLVWLVSRQNQSQNLSRKIIAFEETDLLLWLNLKFKTGIKSIIDSCNDSLQATSSPQIRQDLRHIKASATSLLNSSEKLTGEISHDDET